MPTTFWGCAQSTVWTSVQTNEEVGIKLVCRLCSLCVEVIGKCHEICPSFHLNYLPKWEAFMNGWLLIDCIHSHGSITLEGEWHCDG
jgi:hypothetical protein